MEPIALRERKRRLTQDVILDAAEQLLETNGTADFSMRALAERAGVGFATLFNYFGSKSGIMHALSHRLILRMDETFTAAPPAGDAIDGVLAMGAIGVEALLDRPDVYRAVVGSLGVPESAPSAVRARSKALWATALGDYSGIEETHADLARIALPDQLAFSFRGSLSFWIAGEITDAKLGSAVEAGAAMLLLSLAVPKRRAFLLERIARAEAFL